MIWPHVTQGYLSALEHGQMVPGARVLLAISQAFGKSVFSPDIVKLRAAGQCVIACRLSSICLANPAALWPRQKGKANRGKSEKHHISTASEVLSDGGFIEISRI